MESIDRAFKRINGWKLTLDDMDYINMATSGVYEMQDEVGCLNEVETSDRKQERRRRRYRLGGGVIG